MPVYEYRCRACGNIFSALVASSNTPEKDIICPCCKERQAEKLLSMKSAVIGGHRPTAKTLPCGAPSGSDFT